MATASTLPAAQIRPAAHATTRTTLLIIAVLMITTVVARALPGPRTIDDAFITFRYSRNLVEGQGFVYNPGVATLGTTTPLFAGVLAGIAAVTGGQDFQLYAIAVSALADAATVVLLFLLARRLIGVDWLAALPGLLWAISPMSVTFAVGGMETSVTIFWMTLTMWLFVTASTSDRWRWKEYAVGVAVALGLLTRVDSALLYAPLFFYQLGERWLTTRGQPLIARLPWRTWAGGAVVMLPWLMFSVLYFGSPIPNSVTAKRFAYLIEPGSALAQMIQTYSNPFFEFDTFGPIGPMIGSVLYLTLSAFALLFVARRLPRLLPFVIYPWVYFAAFAILNPLIFRWYMAPPLPALMLGIVVGAWALLRPLAEREGAAQRIAQGIVGALGAVWIFTSVNGWTLTPDHGPERPTPRMAWHALELLYERMGTTLREDYGVTAETRVASGDIGAVGYFSRATIVDTVGLVTPELTAYYPVDPALIAEGQNYAIPPQLIYDEQPAYLVTMEGFVRLGLATEDRFTEAYALELDWPFPFYGASMQLWVRE
ncbi:MAG: glycosyltransferase family 39 protein [Chloroflexi bacterium]|nr:glycosyltransferase family 39 protein [Chloroflexota bacterium]